MKDQEEEEKNHAVNKLGEGALVFNANSVQELQIDLD